MSTILQFFAKVAALLKLAEPLFGYIRKIEEAFPPGSGVHKLGAVLDLIEAAYESEKDIQAAIPWAQLRDIVSGIVNRLVKRFNDVGVFAKGTNA